MLNRRKFLALTTMTAPLALAGKKLLAGTRARAGATPIVVSTWDFGQAANAEAWKILSQGGLVLDAVEAGVRVPEQDPNNESVGLGGLPDRDGRVTLDACIMDGIGNCGSVAALEHIVHAISVARKVMEKTPHVMLVGEGATQFALEQGFPKETLLTPQSEKAWREWLKTSHYQPVMNIENKSPQPGGPNNQGAMPGGPNNQGAMPGGPNNQGAMPGGPNNYDAMPGGPNNHDTIGMVAIDSTGKIGGACTTSGMAFKLHGRVGDSPIIGAGLFVDDEAGAATSTGVGEEVIRICGSHLVVELMRQGRTPQEACEEAVKRIIKKGPERAKTLQVGFLAINRNGDIGAYALQKGFTYAVRTGSVDQVFPSPYFYQT